MERTVALKKLERILGKRLGYRINAKAPTPEERESARATRPAAVEERNALKEQRDARYRETLAADAEYQRLDVAARAARERVDKLMAASGSYRITVGTTQGLFFVVRAQGDSWEEILDKLAAKQAA